MIIDCHGHYTTEPKDMLRWRKEQVDNVKDPPKQPPRSSLKVTDDEIRESVEGNQLNMQRDRGTDVTIFSPRAMGMSHHIGDYNVSLAWAQVCNEMIHRVCTLYPKNFIGVCQLPQSPGVLPESCIPELDRCVNEFGFVGCNLNPDPSGGHWTAPPLTDKYWYKFYEKLCELDVPALVHSASCCSPRESYTLHFITEESIAIVSLLESEVFERFPTLKMVISHGGGAIPYQLARFEAWRSRSQNPERFRDAMRKLYYDTCVYNAEGLDLLFRIVGTDRCMFGTENPGTGTYKDPKSGKMLDDLKPVIESIPGLTDQDRKNVFEDVAKKVFPRFKV